MRGAERSKPMNTSPLVSVTTTAPAAPDFRWEGQMGNGLGATYGLPPAAFLAANAEALVVSGPLGTFRLPRTAVTKLGRGGMYPWFFGGIRIHHRDPKCPEELQFKPLGAHRRDVLSHLRGLGYPVA